MSLRIVVAGSDTGIGKTVFAAALADLIGALYWKPIQAGLERESDSDTVARPGGLSDDRILPERYRLRTPASPHQAAAIDGVRIDANALRVPDTRERGLVIEGSGGLLVPLRWRIPVVLCARTALGTINHSLLSIEALRSRKIELRGIAFIGEANPESERAICEAGAVKRLGRLPRLSPLTRSTLRTAFETSFNVNDFGP
jgi:dethiobiotin synthetase